MRRLKPKNLEAVLDNLDLITYMVGIVVYVAQKPNQKRLLKFC